MPQQTQTSVENNFRNGFVTEFTGLNFPENACTEVFDCELKRDGAIKRRLGFDFEDSFLTKTINRFNSVVNTYLWRNVAGDGNVTLLVLQVGATVYFYKADSGSSFSPGAVATTVALTPVSGAPSNIASVEAQFCDGDGILVITHPYCQPIRVSYNTSTDTATATNITLKIRDFEGDVADPYTVDERPTATFAGLNAHHKYNLFNQGWRSAELTVWDTAQTTMPSNSDVMWRFIDSSGDFNAGNAAIARVFEGNAAAPKGHFILTLSNQDREAISGFTPITATTTGFQRPSTSAFFAGRVFYSGINYVGFNSKIYFTQILERTEQYGFCYQANDPTSEDLFDLLPTDGGVISIPEAGTIYKLFTIPGGIAVFAANGVWFIAGSTGIGFTANDYMIQKISNIKTLSACSFTSVNGLPCWWNSEGIYLMVAEGTQNLPSIKSLTDDKIKSFYDDIPLSSKRFSRGFFHHVDQHIRWIFRSEATAQTTETYEYDRVLNFNLLTGAFYLWRITDSNVKVNAILVSDEVSSVVQTDQVIDDSSPPLTVIDGSVNNVIVFTQAGAEDSPFDKYLVSYEDSGSHKFTFADKTNADYLDWFKYDNTGVNYTSYFITGYKLQGQAIRKFQNNWVRVFSRITDSVSYYFQGIWNYGLTGSGTGTWSTRQIDTQQLITQVDSGSSYVSRRLKVRGHGHALQFRVESVPEEPFEIIGWSTTQSANQAP